MKARWTLGQTLAWGLILTAALYGPNIYAGVRGKGFGSAIPGSGVPDDNSVTSAKVVNGTLLGEDHANNSIDGTKLALTSQATGDLMDYDGTDWARLARGAAGTVLHGAASGAPVYAPVRPADMGDNDFGDITCASGVCGIDDLAIVAGDISAGAVTMNKIAKVPAWGITLCAPGMGAVANVCNVFTDLGSGFTSAGVTSVRSADLADYTHYRITVLLNVATINGDVDVQCDTDSAFGSVDGTMHGPTSPVGTGVTSMAWTAIPAGCLADDIFIRFGLSDGAGATEDPSLRWGEIEFNKGG